MKWIEKLKSLFSGRKEKEQTEIKTEQQPVQRVKRTCKGCGKAFTIDPTWEHIPNYCKDCRKKFAAEKEEKQRAGAPRRIKRKCRECGNFFTFPSTLAHYPNYCSNCRKRHQAAMKEKYSGKARGQKP